MSMRATDTQSNEEVHQRDHRLRLLDRATRLFSARYIFYRRVAYSRCSLQKKMITVGLPLLLVPNTIGVATYITETGSLHRR